MSGVEVRPLSRLPSEGPVAVDPAASGPTDRATRLPVVPALYFPGDADHPNRRPQVIHPARDRAAAGTAGPAVEPVRSARLSRRTRVPGFRPGKATAARAGADARARVPILDEAVEHLIAGRLPRSARPGGHPCRWPTPTWRSSRRRRASRSSSRRPSRSGRTSAWVTTSTSTSRPEIEVIDDARVDQVVEELRDQNATLERGRGPRGPGRRLRRHRVRRHPRR